MCNHEYINNGNDITPYKVIVHRDGQHSMWPVGKDNPPGWRDTAKTGTQEECMNYIRNTFGKIFIP